MLVKMLPVGFLGTNCYIVTDEETLKCAIIDPGADSNNILDYVESNKLSAEVIFLTHGHFDHILALEAVMEATGAPTYMSKQDSFMSGKPNNPLDFANNPGIHWCSEGDSIAVGNLKIVVMETPGHSPGSLTLMCESALFTGDTLFRDSCGRTDLEGGNMDTLLMSLRRLAALEGDYEVYPGHMEASTLDRERRFNYYVRLALGDS